MKRAAHKSRACRHCGSPAKGNPCWRGVTIKNWVGDPPCVLDGLEYEDIGRDRREPMFECFRGVNLFAMLIVWIFGAMLALGAITILYAVVRHFAH